MNVGDGLGSEFWPLEWRDTTVRAHPIRQKEKDAFSSWLARKVIRPFLEMQAEGPGYDRAVELVADRIAEGRYGFHEEVSQKAMRAPDGAFVLTRLVFQIQEGRSWRPITDDEMVELIAEHSQEVRVIMQQVFARSFPQVVRASANGDSEGEDPNAPAPEGSPSGQVMPSSSSTPVSSTSPGSSAPGRSPS